jgi:hypothetical protein
MPKIPALWIFRRTVVMPKPINPKGAGFAVLSLITLSMSADKLIPPLSIHDEY